MVWWYYQPCLCMGLPCFFNRSSVVQRRVCPASSPRAAAPPHCLRPCAGWTASVRLRSCCWPTAGSSWREVRPPNLASSASSCGKGERRRARRCWRRVPGSGGSWGCWQPPMLDLPLSWRPAVRLPSYCHAFSLVCLSVRRPDIPHPHQTGRASHPASCNWRHTHTEMPCAAGVAGHPAGA